MSTDALPPEATAAQAANSTPTGAMIRTLGLVSAICGLIIVSSYQGTLSAVQANKQIAVERAVFKVLPEAKSIVEYQVTPSGVSVITGELPAGAVKFYGAYDDAGKLNGIAAEGGAKGYGDTVRVLFGYKLDCQCVVGFGVVSMRETPGIGDKILTDKDFLANFVALDAQLNKELSGLANEVKTVKHGTKTKAWEIDAIAGATITSRAVGRAINQSAQALLPLVAPQFDKIRTKS